VLTSRRSRGPDGRSAEPEFLRFGVLGEFDELPEVRGHIAEQLLDFGGRRVEELTPLVDSIDAAVGERFVEPSLKRNSVLEKEPCTPNAPMPCPVLSARCCSTASSSATLRGKEGAPVSLDGPVARDRANGAAGARSSVAPPSG
tara:strand:- start:3030 stop:3461 length:432 start_codon:yes stop_codon:yes gene_type:complete